ncbi:hypothetical protein Tco_0015439 [Tanacetum coccineum]
MPKRFEVGLARSLCQSMRDAVGLICFRQTQLVKWVDFERWQSYHHRVLSQSSFTVNTLARPTIAVDEDEFFRGRDAGPGEGSTVNSVALWRLAVLAFRGMVRSDDAKRGVASSVECYICSRGRTHGLRMHIIEERCERLELTESFSDDLGVATPRAWVYVVVMTSTGMLCHGDLISEDAKQAHTPVTVDTDSEPEQVPSETEEFDASKPSNTRITSSHSSASSDSTAPLLPDHPLTQTSPTPTPTRVSFHSQIAEAVVLSPSSFHKRYRSSYETSSLSPSALPSRKRYQGILELVEDTEDESPDSNTKREGSEDEDHDSEDEGHGLKEEEEEATPEGQQQTALAKDTTMDEPLRLGYKALRCHELVVREGEMPKTFEVGYSSKFVSDHEGADRISAFRQPTLVTWVDLEDGRVYTDIPTYVLPVEPAQTPPSPEWSSGSLPISLSSLVVPTPVASPVTTLAATIAVDEDEFLEGYDRDLRELYTRSGAVRDEIFSQRYRFRSLEREQERATVTFSAIWRPVLALEAWAGQTDAQRAAPWHAIYDTQRENHDLRMHIIEERCERLELTDHVARMEGRQESRGEQ